MPVPLVQIVNPNGQIGVVAASSDAARAYSAPPSARAKGREAARLAAIERDDPFPAFSASTDVWREFATSHGLSSEEAEALTRDELVDHFTKSEED